MLLFSFPRKTKVYAMVCLPKLANITCALSVALLLAFQGPVLAASKSIVDYNVSPPLKLDHPKTSWAVRIGPFETNDRVSNTTKAIAKINSRLLAGKNWGGGLWAVTRFSPRTGKAKIFLEVSALTQATAQNTCGPFVEKGYECADYDKVLFDLSRRAYLMMYSLFLSEPFKIRVQSQKCYEGVAGASATKLATDFASCFFLDYSYAEYLSSLDKSQFNDFNRNYWTAEGKLQKEMIKVHSDEGFGLLSTPMNERSTLIQIWEEQYTETSAWYKGQTIGSMLACMEVGIGTAKCP